jgi:hypothetical protein
MAAAQNNDRPRQPRGDQPSGERPQRGQRPGGREPLTAEQSKAAWTLESNGVSKRLGPDAEKTKAVAKAYAEARESYEKAQQKVMADMREKMQDADDRRQAMQEMQKAMQEMNKTEKEKFEKSLSSSLSADQVTKASASLGSLMIGRQWDGMVHSVSEFKLEESKQDAALNAIEDYVVAVGKNRPSPDADREEMQKTMRETREKLNESLKKVLSEEQFKKFEEENRAMGRFGPGGPGGGPGGPGGRGGRDRENGGG